MPYLRCVAQEDRKGHSKFYPLELLEVVFKPSSPPFALLTKPIAAKDDEQVDEKGVGGEKKEEEQQTQTPAPTPRRRRWASINSYESSSYESSAEDVCDCAINRQAYIESKPAPDLASDNKEENLV
jgi:hypothetical protein